MTNASGPGHSPSHGEGLGNQFLNHIQGVDAIAHIVRCFEDANVAHTSPNLDPIADAEIIITELIMKDLEIAERRLDRLKTAIRIGDKMITAEFNLLNEIKENLARNIQIKQMNLTNDQLEIIKTINLYTIVFLPNASDAISSSRIDRSTRPNGECTIFLTTITVITTKTKTIIK